MKHLDKYLEYRAELWSEFENLVRQGAKFSEVVFVRYPRGENPKGLSLTTEGDSWFHANELVANPNYKLHIGVDIIVGTTPVTFLDLDDKPYLVEPDILDIHWLCELLDAHEKI